MSTNRWSFFIFAALIPSFIQACSFNSSDVKTISKFDTVGIGTSEVYASIPGDDGGWIAVKLQFPETGRYEGSEGDTKAPILVETPPFFYTTKSV